jgi:hypothetical protein
MSVHEIDSIQILNLSDYDYIGLSFIPLNDVLYLYPSTIISIIGSILNIFCVVVYFKKEFGSSMFFYFRVLSVCYLIQNLAGIPYSLCNAPRYISEENRKLCAEYLTANIIFGSLLTYYESVLEIAIVLDRLKTFNNTINKHLRLTPQKFSIILFIICFIVDLFYMFVFTPKEFSWYNHRENGTLEKRTVWFVVTSDFALSNISRIFIILTYFVREFVTILFSVLFSIFLLMYMRTYFKNKAKIVKKSKSKSTLPNVSSTVKSSSARNSTKQLSNSEEKFILMVIFQCSLTILTRTNLFTCCLLALFSYDALTQIWCAVADFNILFTASVSFFINFFFNKLFKKEFMKLFNK